MWTNTDLDLGEVKEGTKKLFNFEYKGDLQKDLDYIKPCCGSCTTVVSKDTNSFKAEFKADNIPVHLNVSVWEVEKCIHVYMKSGVLTRLTFKVKIVK